MNNLPSEILHNIFIRVPLQQRLICTLVCRYWYNSLRSRSLLYDIDITSDSKFTNFIDMIQRMPGRGSQVEIIKLEIARHHLFDKRKLCYMLPNLHIFENVEKRRCDSRFIDFCIQPFELVDPNSKLESIVDIFKCEIPRHLLRFGSCTRLKKLELELKYIGNPRTEIFIHLKNAPVLKELDLRRCKIGIEDFEIIHENTPALEFFDLSEITLIPCELPRDIAPATSLRGFSMVIEILIPYSSFPVWYKYAAKKYINLTSFSCYTGDFAGGDARQMMEIYRDGVLPLYKNIGRHLDHFDAINVPTELNVFKKLDEFGSQISHFLLEYNRNNTILEQLLESNQIKYTESLEFQNTFIASPIIFKNFTSLRKLDIDSNYEATMDANLIDYLNAFPATLTSFSASFLNAEINELPDHPNNIQELYLQCKQLSPKLAEIISLYFPKLNDIFLTGGVIEDLDINLPNNHFKQLRMNADYFGERSPVFSLIDSTQPQPQYYIRDGFSLNGPQRVTSEEIHNRIKINLKYKSVTKVILETCVKTSNDSD